MRSNWQIVYCQRAGSVNHAVDAGDELETAVQVCLRCNIKRTVVQWTDFGQADIQILSNRTNVNCMVDEQTVLGK